MKLWPLVLTFGLVLGSMAYAGEPGAPVTIDSMVQDLAGPDAHLRAVARQMLPRESVEAVPKLIPLLANESPEVSWAAMRVIEDLANQCGVPGREADRKAVTDALMVLLAKEQPVEMREKGLRLLPIVIPDDHDLSPIASLLSDETLREKARGALVLVGSRKAAMALAAAVDKAEPAFKVALLDALAVLRRPESEKAALKCVKAAEPEVRVAAARALAWTANLKHLPVLQEIRAGVEGPLRKDAEDAMLRLADAMMRSGGKWEYAMRVYRELLASSQNIMIQGAAVAGLGRYGDDTAVKDILAAAQTQRDLEGPALSALRAMYGNACNQALLEAYPTANDSLRWGLLPVLGEKKDARFLEILNQAAQGQDPACRTAAIAALSASELPGAVDGLAAVANNGTPEDKAFSVKALDQMALSMATRGEHEAAGKAYLGMYQAATDDALKAQAIEGVKRFPVADSFDLILQHLSPEEVAAMDAGSMAGIIKAMNDAGRTEDAQKLSSALFTRLNTPEDLQKAVQFLLPTMGAEELGKRLGVLRQWKLAGPFPWVAADAFSKTHINEPAIDLAATYSENNLTISWVPAETQDLLGILDLTSIYGMAGNATAYAFARIKVDAETQAQIRCGSDDGIKVWVNGVAAHENAIDRGALPDQDKANVALRAGENDILVQITQGGGGWCFCLRLTGADGSPLAFSLVGL